MDAPNSSSIAAALRSAGPRPWLLGYDANGIQELITASSRPITMLGASAAIAGFDSDMRHARTVFAGGGRGVELASSRDEAENRGKMLATEFCVRTHGGVLATVAIPYDPDAARGSLRWFHSALELAKDRAPPVGIAHLQAPRRKSDECAHCNTYVATHVSQRKDAPDERVCRRCHELADVGRKRHGVLAERIQSLVSLDPAERWIAAVSIDGNNLGDFFRGLDSLAAMKEASEAMFKLFKESDRAARGRLKHDVISLATGGDDLRLFMAASDLLTYVETLVPAIEAGADRLTRSGLSGLGGFGVGIGAVIADPRLPARQLMAHAHELERSAKKICRPGRPNFSRSGFDFAVLTAGTGSIDDPGIRKDKERPIGMPQLGQLKAAAEHLTRIPTSQRALLSEQTGLEPEEFANLLRYQVARSRDWQAWYAACGHDWRDPQVVVEQRPHAVHLDLARLLGV